MDGENFSIGARITDAAGNYIDWISTTTLQIDGIKANDRPEITSATATNNDGWWSPTSPGLPIYIQIGTAEQITVDVTEGIPFITLKTGSESDGIATYDVDNSSGSIMTFVYTPSINQTTLDNVDYRLEFKEDDNQDTIIHLNGGLIYEASGNFLRPADNSENPELIAFDETKILIIDGVAPEDLSEQQVTSTA